MKKFKNTILSLVLVFSILVYSSTTALAMEVTNQKNNIKDVEYVLEKSPLKKMAEQNKDAKKLYDKIKNKGKSVTETTQYVRTDRMSSTNSTNYGVLLDSNSGNRYSWVKLTIQAFDLGSKYQFVGFYEWKGQPFFRGTDVFALGHDSGIGFFTNTAVGFSQCNALDRNDKVVEYTNTLDFSKNKQSTTSDASGVAFSVNLSPANYYYCNNYVGYLSCEGKLNVRNPNLQVSYGHSELALSVSLSSAIEWKANGSISFDVVGSQDLATHGDAIRR